MSFKIKRIASSKEQSPQNPKRVWRHSSKMSSSKKTFTTTTFYTSQQSGTAFSSVEFQTKIKAKRTLKSILNSACSYLTSLNISSKSWCLYDSKKAKYFGFRQKNQRQIASLTKIMTTIISIQFFEQYQMNPDLYVKVTENATKMIGTSAQLRPKTWVRFKDLFYGAMLPSGNDAAFLLSQIIGYLSKLQGKKRQYLRNLKFLDISNENTTLCTVQFVKLMNKKAEQIGMPLTQFSNPHGLQNAMNISSPKDMIILSCYASNNPYFRKIMNTQLHKYDYIQLVAQTPQSDQNNISQIENVKGTSEKVTKKEKLKIVKKSWTNTNTLLEKGWEGIKTGQTGPAGSCLSSLREGIFIVVLNCKDNEARFTETQKIYDWYVSKKKSQSTDDQDNCFK